MLPVKGAQGSVLVIVMCMCALVFVVVASYLTLAQFRNTISAHSTDWNQAIPVAEAGIEDALSQVQRTLTPSSGWTLVSNYYTKTRTQPFGDTNTYYAVSFMLTNPPIITATGYVRAPMKSTYISRVVQVTTKHGGQYPYGMLSKGAISMSGGNALLDSFNSTDPNYSTNGQYIASKSEANMKVASDSTNANAISVGNGTIYGSIDTGPGTNTVSVGSNGSVGDSNWVTSVSGTGQIQAGHSNDDMNVYIPDIQPPFSTGNFTLPTPLGLIGGTNYSYVLGSNNYYYSSALLWAGQTMVVTGAATLYVVGSFSMSGGSMIYIAPGGSLQLYVGTTNANGNDSISISGNGIANGSGNATNLALYGLPSVTTASYSGNAEFIGTMNAPEAAVTLSGNAAAVGAIIANTITMSGGMSFHYDEALANTVGGIKYVVTSWREL